MRMAQTEAHVNQAKEEGSVSARLNVVSTRLDQQPNAQQGKNESAKKNTCKNLHAYHIPNSTSQIQTQVKFPPMTSYFLPRPRGPSGGGRALISKQIISMSSFPHLSLNPISKFLIS